MIGFAHWEHGDVTNGAHLCLPLFPWELSDETKSRHWAIDSVLFNDRIELRRTNAFFPYRFLPIASESVLQNLNPPWSQTEMLCEQRQG